MTLADIAISFRYGVGDHALEEEIVRNVRAILSTPIGTCPLYRDFGIDVTILDRLVSPVELNRFTVAIIDAVEQWEPRVRVVETRYENNVDGTLKAKVVLDYEG